MFFCVFGIGEPSRRLELVDRRLLRLTDHLWLAIFFIDCIVFPLFIVSFLVSLQLLSSFLSLSGIWLWVVILGIGLLG